MKTLEQTTPLQAAEEALRNLELKITRGQQRLASIVNSVTPVRYAGEKAVVDQDRDRLPALRLAVSKARQELDQQAGEELEKQPARYSN
jgi:hypothetical protein